MLNDKNFFARSNEILNTRERVMKIPRLRSSSTHGNKTPDEQHIGAQAALFLGPIRIQQDFLALIVMSRYNY